jgi:hypothetical protein
MYSGYPEYVTKVDTSSVQPKTIEDLVASVQVSCVSCAVIEVLDQVTPGPCNAIRGGKNANRVMWQPFVVLGASLRAISSGT